MSRPDSNSEGKVIPAQLNFLAIYNESLSTSEETQHEQIVFYYSRTAREEARRRKKANNKNETSKPDHEINEDKNEQLRQVGLAQGIVNFARGFSNGEPVESVENEKSHIVLKELEKGWWILASIDLTRLPNTKAAPVKQFNKTTQTFEYSAREVSPPSLLIQHLVQAYRIFLLHHGPSLSSIFVRLDRRRFCDSLDRFWTRFALTWDVLIHGNPSVDIYDGIKLSASGELGIGVGEEEWGSGERDVLEGLVKSTDGLIDVTLSRFGKEKKQVLEEGSQDNDDSEPWLGSRRHPRAEDGLVCSGTGRLSKKSLRVLSKWTQWIYTYGEDAYGVKDNPHSTRRKRRKLAKLPETSPEGIVQSAPTQDHKQNERPNIPPPIISTAEIPQRNKVASTNQPEKNDSPQAQSDRNTEKTSASNAFTNPENWMKVLTLGYGTSWGQSEAGGKTVPHDTPPSADTSRGDVPVDKYPTNRSEQPDDSHSMDIKGDTHSSSIKVSKRSNRRTNIENTVSEEKKDTNRLASREEGYFLIGLKGNLDDDQLYRDREEQSDSEAEEQEEWNSRLVIRTVFLELTSSTSNDINSIEGGDEDDKDELDLALEKEPKTTRLRVLIYVHKPFVYTFIFDNTTPSLSIPSFYHELHNHLQPLHTALLRSTDPSNAPSRIASYAGYSPSRQKESIGRGIGKPTHDFIFSPQSLNVRTSIPNIQEHGDSQAVRWTRQEALQVHLSILHIHSSTRLRKISGRRKERAEREKIVKTGRGWWVNWFLYPFETSTTAEVDGKDRHLASTVDTKAEDDEGEEDVVEETASSNASTKPLHSALPSPEAPASDQAQPASSTLTPLKTTKPISRTSSFSSSSSSPSSTSPSLSLQNPNHSRSIPEKDEIILLRPSLTSSPSSFSTSTKATESFPSSTSRAFSMGLSSFGSITSRLLGQSDSSSGMGLEEMGSAGSGSGSGSGGEKEEFDVEGYVEGLVGLNR